MLKLVNFQTDIAFRESVLVLDLNNEIDAAEGTVSIFANASKVDMVFAREINVILFQQFADTVFFALASLGAFFRMIDFIVTSQASVIIQQVIAFHASDCWILVAKLVSVQMCTLGKSSRASFPIALMAEYTQVGNFVMTPLAALVTKGHLASFEATLDVLYTKMECSDVRLSLRIIPEDPWTFWKIA
jgi:hypothetical protein